jgi:hypothetical protein
MAVSAALVEDDNGVAATKSEETHELLDGLHDSELQLTSSAAVARHLCTSRFSSRNGPLILAKRPGMRPSLARSRAQSLAPVWRWPMVAQGARWRRAIYQ